MFGKFMNNYYYGKSGKGDYKKEDLPTNRWQLFWEMLRVRFSGLVRLNLMYLVAWLPTIIVLFYAVTMAITGLNEAIAEDGTMLTDVSALMQSIITMTLVLLVPCIAITGFVTPGVAYVTRNWSRDEHAFIWSDFKDAIKENWKQGVVVSLITSVVPLIVYICWNFYGEMSVENPIMSIPQVLVAMLGVLWAISVTYMHPLIVGYKLRFRDLMRNSFLLAVARLPFSVGIRLLHCLPLVICIVLILVIPPAYSMYCVLALFLYYLLIGFSLSRFVTASFCNGVFDRYINSRIEGSVVNRGLNTDVDDDDEDEETEEE